MYSGHPMGLFPSHKDAPRVVVTNGMMIPNYSKPDDWEKFNALGVTQYGQMTAGSYMYIGPQGIVHGTTITVLNAFRKIKKITKRKLICYFRTRRNEWCTTKSWKYCRLYYGLCRSESKNHPNTITIKVGLMK